LRAQRLDGGADLGAFSGSSQFPAVEVEAVIRHLAGDLPVVSGEMRAISERRK